jgi:hypothetical protein
VIFAQGIKLPSEAFFRCLHTNNQGNQVDCYFWSGDRYYFDQACPPKDGWIQYDTSQDAWYFGSWVNVKERKTVTYCEGDIYIVTCPTIESFKAELADMQRVYGDPPPMAVAFDADGTKTVYYDENARPKLEGV